MKPTGALLVELKSSRQNCFTLTLQVETDNFHNDHFGPISTQFDLVCNILKLTLPNTSPRRYITNDCHESVPLFNLNPTEGAVNL